MVDAEELQKLSEKLINGGGSDDDDSDENEVSHSTKSLDSDCLYMSI